MWIMCRSFSVLCFKRWINFVSQVSASFKFTMWECEYCWKPKVNLKQLCCWPAGYSKFFSKYFVKILYFLICKCCSHHYVYYNTTYNDLDEDLVYTHLACRIFWTDILPYTIHVVFFLNTLRGMRIKCLKGSPWACSLHPYSIKIQCFELFITWVLLMSRVGFYLFSVMAELFTRFDLGLFWFVLWVFCRGRKA